jgi:hypothetical protein
VVAGRIAVRELELREAAGKLAATPGAEAGDEAGIAPPQFGAPESSRSQVFAVAEPPA